MPLRRDVYAAIDSERSYQLQKWAGHCHEADTWCLYMEDYLQQARQQASRTNFDDPANLRAYLDTIRKVTTLGVACMEAHGAPLREGF